MNSPKRDPAVRILPVGLLLDGRYQIKKCLGIGGMGAVYLADDIEDKGTLVAVKVLHPKLLTDPKIVERFNREAELSAKVEHPNVVRVLSVGQEDDLLYLTMNYIRGEPLEQILKRGPFPLERVPGFLLQTVQALTAIHKEGIVHRDLKPANILVTQALDIHLIDFGSARSENSRLTSNEEVLGSPCYIAPELWLGKPPSPAADYYSLGVILYELVVGDVPFDDTWPAAIMKRHLDDEPVPPRTLNPRTPVWLNDLILELLIKSAELRCCSASLISGYVRLHSEQAPTPEVKLREQKRRGLSSKFRKHPWAIKAGRAMLRMAFVAGLSLIFYLTADFIVQSMIR